VLELSVVASGGIQEPSVCFQQLNHLSYFVAFHCCIVVLLDNNAKVTKIILPTKQASKKSIIINTI